MKNIFQLIQNEWVKIQFFRVYKFIKKKKLVQTDTSMQEHLLKLHRLLTKYKLHTQANIISYHKSGVNYKDKVRNYVYNNSIFF